MSTGILLGIYIIFENFNIILGSDSLWKKRNKVLDKTLKKKLQVMKMW